VSLCVRRPFARFVAAACFLISALALAACAGIKIPGSAPTPQAGSTVPGRPGALPQTVEPIPPAQLAPPATTAAPGKVNVALLLPLSGPSAALGQAMLNAAQMALFDLADDRLELLTRDTQGSAAGAANAAQSVIAGGAQLILGPLLQAEVEAVKPIAQSARVPVIAFSTATQLAGGGTYLMGFTPDQEINRVTAYAHNKASSGSRCWRRARPMARSLPRRFAPPWLTTHRAWCASSFTIPRSTTWRRRCGALPAKGAISTHSSCPKAARGLKALAPQLPYFNIDPSKVKFLGTGLWDEPGLGTEPSLDGGWYAAPAPASRAAFEKRYQELYKTKPARLATLGYDATALAAVLTRAPQGADFSAPTLTSPNGFAGIDGIFRLRTDGLVQRGLAVLEVHRGAGTIIDPAPQSFQDFGL